jgi:hypothetical protein
MMKVRSFSPKVLASLGLIGTIAMLAPFNFAQDRSTKDAMEVRNVHEPPLMGAHWAREFAHTARRNSSPNMLWHNGAIMTSSAVTVIYWGTSWISSNPKIAGLESFYTGFSGSNYAKTSDEYTGSNGQVGSGNSYGGYVIDTTPAAGGNQTSAILAEVCRATPNPVSNGYYPVYTDIKRGNAGYCAWHSYGTCGSTPVQFAFFFNLDGDPGCDPQDTQTGHPQGLAALANVSAHELSEARTDPRNGGWYDSSGAENGDKCAWTFNVPYVSFTNKSVWKLQGEWSNAAYNGRTGYANNSGQLGCLDGH